MKNNWKIINKDVFDYFSECETKYDLIITSPPYNANKEYEDSLDVSKYKRFAKRWIDNVLEILSEDGSFWLNVGYTEVGNNQTLPLTYLYHDIVNIPLVQEIVWHYNGGMSYTKRFTHRTERWVWFSKDPENCTFNLDDVRDPSLNKTNDSRNHPKGKNPTDYWQFNRVVGGSLESDEKTVHPCQFPEKLIKRIILACSNEEDRVFDPFVGSGTTVVVAKKLNRMGIGVEKEEKYIPEARERLNRSSVGEMLKNNKWFEFNSN